MILCPALFLNPKIKTMRLSTYNIFSKIRDSRNYFIVNLLTGNADIVEPAVADKINQLSKGELLNDEPLINELMNKGYLMDEVAEKKLYRAKYLDFIDSRDDDEIQLFFVPNYACNFACTYCYQDEYSPKASTLSNEMIDAFFQYIENEFTGRRKYLTIFGGEPLLDSPRQREITRYLIDKANAANLDVCFVTNGYTLSKYTDILKQGSIREVQVTLDGTATYHNARRFLKDGSGTFDKIIEGIDACLQNHITINLRMVIDKENINNLPELAQYAIDKGWTQSLYFKTQVGRNYELHHCQSAPDKLFTRVSLYEQLFGLIKEHPHIVEFYKPAYSITKFLAEQGELPDPLFDSCPACKTEWAFDYTGNIYSCTATVGKTEESLGTFYPQVVKKEDVIKQWENRDVTSIPKCSGCNLQLACGGGCGSVAKNQNGTICSADCRPVKELLELGFAAYLT
jgi:uncharacterized protein